MSVCVCMYVLTALQTRVGVYISPESERILVPKGKYETSEQYQQRVLKNVSMVWYGMAWYGMASNRMYL